MVKRSMGARQLDLGAFSFRSDAARTASTCYARSKGSMMQTHRRVIRFIPPALAVLLFTVVTAASRAQAPGPATTGPATAGPVAQAAPVDSHHISIDVEVTDKLGHHVSGLTAGDFTLLDNKQPRGILDFHEVDTHNSATDPVHVIIVVDAINTEFIVVAKEREQLDEYLKQDGGHLAHPTSLAFLTEKGLNMQRGSSLDGNALLASLDAANSELRSVGRNAGFWGATERFQWSLDQLGQLAAYESTQPGRKLALFVSPGWPLLAEASVEPTDKQLQWTFKAVVGLTNALREAQLVLYAIDPRTLGRADPFYYQSYLKAPVKVNQAAYPHLGLQVMATHSGGLVEVTGIDVLGAINTAVRDANAYYTLTFEAPSADRVDEYHDLHLQVDKPGVAVRTTAGYYANVQH
ncbi:MAG TPA: VWA domain-containing protein [Terracidiphilus sp.]|jgi:VWFA-related protein